MKAARLVLLFLVLVSAVGCFQYVPTHEWSHRQGTPMRLHLERPASFELPSLTAHNIGLLDGELVRLDGDDVVVSTTWLEAVTSGGFDGGGWTLRIPRRDVTTVELKRFSWWRTGVVLAAVATSTFLGFEALGGSGSGGGQPGSGGVIR